MPTSAASHVRLEPQHERTSADSLSEPNLPQASINFNFAAANSINKYNYFIKLSKIIESLFMLFLFFVLVGPVGLLYIICNGFYANNAPLEFLQRFR